VGGTQKLYMIEGGIYFWLLPLGRTLVGFMIGLFLAVMGGWMATNFNQLTGYSWALDFHRNIYFVWIGLGAGFGAYVGWMTFAVRWYLIGVSLILILIGGIAGTYIGLLYGETIDPTYMGQRATIVNTIHWGAAIGGIVVATALGLFNELRTKGR